MDRVGWRVTIQTTQGIELTTVLTEITFLYTCMYICCLWWYPSASAVSFLEEHSVCLKLQLMCAFALNSGKFFSKEIKIFLECFADKETYSIICDTSTSQLSLPESSTFSEGGLNSETKWFSLRLYSKAHRLPSLKPLQLNKVHTEFQIRTKTACWCCLQ